MQLIHFLYNNYSLMNYYSLQNFQMGVAPLRRRCEQFIYLDRLIKMQNFMLENKDARTLLTVNLKRSTGTTNGGILKKYGNKNGICPLLLTYYYYQQASACFVQRGNVFNNAYIMEILLWINQYGICVVICIQRSFICAARHCEQYLKLLINFQ